VSAAADIYDWFGVVIDGVNTAQVARSIITESWFVFDCAIVLFIGSYLYNQIRVKGWTEAKMRIGNRAAMAIGTHFTGLIIIRGWSTAMYWMLRHGLNPNAVEDQYGVALFGLCIAAFGMASCIRIFSPVAWGNRGWIVTFVITALFVIYMQDG
jgi:hypothetical protein